MLNETPKSFDLKVNKLTRLPFESPSDEKGTFRWIPKTLLRVDHTYQRDFRRSKVLLIAPCVGAGLRVIRDDRDTFRKSWPLVAALHRGEPIHSEVLEGVWYLYKHTDGKLAYHPVVSQFD